MGALAPRRTQLCVALSPNSSVRILHCTNLHACGFQAVLTRASPTHRALADVGNILHDSSAPNSSGGASLLVRQLLQVCTTLLSTCPQWWHAGGQYCHLTNTIAFGLF